MSTHTELNGLPERATWGRVLADQRKVEITALGLMVFCLWFRQLSDSWVLPLSLAAGILLALVNHLVTERWLLRTISSGEAFTKAQLRRFTMLRLAVLAIVAVGVSALLWPDGVGVLLGLAIFRLIALVMTTIPLLKELKNQ
ncbi:MAG TPA: ATP synthase subunit I [Nocardioides sp.]|nr:ATP synthase subunit I [Nocardioides sp.]